MQHPLVLFGDGQEGVLDSLLVKGKQLNWRKTEDSTLFEKAVLSLNAGPTVVYRHTQWVPKWAHTPVQEEATKLRVVADPVALAVIKAPCDTSTSALESLKGSLVKLAAVFKSRFYVLSTDKVVRDLCASQLVHFISKIADIVDPLKAMSVPVASTDDVVVIKKSFSRLPHATPPISDSHTTTPPPTTNTTTPAPAPATTSSLPSKQPPATPVAAASTAPTSSPSTTAATTTLKATQPAAAASSTKPAAAASSTAKDEEKPKAKKKKNILASLAVFQTADTGPSEEVSAQKKAAAAQSQKKRHKDV